MKTWSKLVTPTLHFKTRYNEQCWKCFLCDDLIGRTCWRDIKEGGGGWPRLKKSRHNSLTNHSNKNCSIPNCNRVLNFAAGLFSKDRQTFPRRKPNPNKASIGGPYTLSNYNFLAKLWYSRIELLANTSVYFGETKAFITYAKIKFARWVYNRYYKKSRLLKYNTTSWSYSYLNFLRSCGMHDFAWQFVAGWRAVGYRPLLSVRGSTNLFFYLKQIFLPWKNETKLNLIHYLNFTNPTNIKHNQL